MFCMLMESWLCVSKLQSMLLIDNPSYAACTPDTPPLHTLITDGRKIQVGDCALFQAGNAPPFIGIIRRLSADKEDCLKLCVTWLYRPADVNLANGLLLEAAPNEVFYSSHKGIIAIASLLHPCKVAFLGKGVKLPSGISSFVCRRFYDKDNKCLWWLTDQSYIKKRREELDLLLDKTRQEMHATVQSGGYSPKRLDGPTSAQQLASTTESLQSNGTTFSSQIKGKKRGRGDQGMESIKRECFFKADHGDSVVCKLENVMIKAEISKITKEGALVTTDGVEKLVQLMHVDNNGILDLAGRVLLADVIAATDRNDCLNKFVQIRGLPILDEWLQEAHKGKAGDGSSPKETDKAVEELVLSLLRALDKLPVNLNALQTCNIGKSVNHLRSSKNLEIQKKARSLVDTWKKRVDAEMKTIDTKTVGSSQVDTWPVKPGFTEISTAGNRRTGLANLSMKNSITHQSICKDMSPADGVVRSTTLIAGSPKLQSSSLTPVAINSKAVCGTGALDMPHMVSKEEKSSSLNQSQNNSQPRSSDHVKTISPSLKEDARSSTARSMNASKTSVGSSHPRSSSNGYMASTISGGQKYSSKSGSVSKTSVVDQVSQSILSCERMVDMPVSDHGSSHRFIVRLPNPNRSPARSISGSSLENPLASSRASSPDVSDKHDRGDPKEKTRNNAGRNDISANLNAESWQSNDVKEGLTGYDEGVGSPTVIPEEEVRRAVEAVSAVEISRTACSSSGDEKGTTFTDPKRRDSFSSMNALVESCAKYSEASTPLPDGDDVGMNLLASVATGEMPKSDLVSPATSPGSSPVKEDHCVGSNEPEFRFSSGGTGNQILITHAENTDFDSHNDGNESGSVSAKDHIQKVGPKFTCSDKNVPLLLEGIKEELNREDLDQNNYTQGVDGQIGDDFTVKSKERSPVRETKSSDHVCEKIADGSIHTSDSDTKLQSHCVGGNSVRQHPLDKIEDGPATLTGKRRLSITEVTTEAVEDDCQDASDMNASAEEHTGSTSSSHVLANGAETNERKGSLECCVSGSVGNDELTTIPRSAEVSAKKEELVLVTEATSFITTAEQDAGAKLDFDLNEGVAGEDVNESEPVTIVAPGFTATTMPSLPPFISPLVLSNLPAPITVAAPAKGRFLPPENLLKCKGPGWKGSAATSAFRPAEPRKFLDTLFSTDVLLFDSAMAKHGHPQLDIDLNVPDYRVLDDLASENSPRTMQSESGVINSNNLSAPAIGGLDLDLNRVDEDADNAYCSANSIRKLKDSPLPERSVTETIANVEVNMSREFDLNNRPMLIEVGAEPVLRRQMLKSISNVSFVPSITALRMNHDDAGNGWFPAGNSYPAVAAPFLPDRGGSSYPMVAAAGAAQTILRSATASGAYGSDVYRGPVLSSSPAMAFSPGATSLPYAGFSFGSSLPLASTCFTSGPTTFVDSSAGGGSYFPPIFSQFVGPVGAMPSPYPRPYVISLPDNNASGGTESNRKWVRQGLDLNTGPGSTEELKEDRILPLPSRQISATSSHILMEDQARLYQLGSGGLKRKVPGAWETERFNYSQSSWKLCKSDGIGE